MKNMILLFTCFSLVLLYGCKPSSGEDAGSVVGISEVYPIVTGITLTTANGTIIGHIGANNSDTPVNDDRYSTRLFEAFPNPCNRSTQVTLRLSSGSYVLLWLVPALPSYTLTQNTTCGAGKIISSPQSLVNSLVISSSYLSAGLHAFEVSTATDNYTLGPGFYRLYAKVGVKSSSSRSEPLLLWTDIWVKPFVGKISQ